MCLVFILGEGGGAYDPGVLGVVIYMRWREWGKEQDENAQ